MKEKLSEKEQIAFHKGALQVLAGEQQELMKMLNMVQQIIKAHVTALKDLGVDLEKEAKERLENLKKEQSKKLDERIA